MRGEDCLNQKIGVHGLPADVTLNFLSSPGHTPGFAACPSEV